MQLFDQLGSRNLSTGLAQRTLKNLEYIWQAHEHHADVHIVTQLVNSLLGLLVFPVEKERRFFNSFRAVQLADPPDFSLVCRRLSGFPPLPSLRTVHFEDCPDLGKFFRRLRNAVSHRRIAFSSDSHNLADVIITLCDAPSRVEPADWEIRLSADDLAQLCLYIAHEVIRRQL